MSDGPSELRAILTELLERAASPELRQATESLREAARDTEVDALVDRLGEIIATAHHLERENRLLLAAWPDPMFTLDARGEILTATSSTQEVLGWEPAELRGRTVCTLVAERDGAKIAGALERASTSTNSAVVEVGELNGRRRDGSEFPSEFRLARTALDPGSHATFALTIRDRTKQKLLETQLLHAQKMESIGQLAAGVSHEINTPIQYVGDNLRFIDDAFQDLTSALDKARDVLSAAEHDEAVDGPIQSLFEAWKAIDIDYLSTEVPSAIAQSLDGVDRVASIVRAMKAFSHPNDDKLVALDVNQALASTVTVARNEWKYCSEVVTEFDANLPTISCYAGELNQVFLNLIVNAAHAIKERLEQEGTTELGRITVGTAQVDDYVEISVSDTGCGVPEELRTRIFEPFFTTKEVGKGTGQGLSLAHGVVVDRHQGQVYVEDEPSGGARFRLRIPMDLDDPDREDDDPRNRR